jgi:hypothetical protein
LLLTLPLLTACSTSLPKGQHTVRSPWNNFNEVKSAYDKIELHLTTTQELQDLGFDPYSTPNVRILSYLDIIKRFSPSNLVQAQDLPPSVLNCLASRANCIAYEATPRVTHSERVGNVFLDLLKFERKKIETGWQFNALIVIDHDTAVYKVWSGTPFIDEIKTHKNPLGPLQGSFGSIAKDAVDI